MTRSAHPLHHGSHCRLLDTPHATARADLDAIIVPTARPIAYLRTVLPLARDLDCPLLALCSKKVTAREARRAARALNIDLVACDVTDGARIPTPQTSGLLVGTGFERDVDSSLKRNLGLLVAAAAGWRRVLFLDDDNLVTRPDEVRRAAALLDEYDVVGLNNHGFADNSVVCHAYRHAGGRQDRFIGAGALVVAPRRAPSFFPEIYNDDWFFLLDGVGLGRVAAVGEALQLPFDPFADTERARSEELGDCLAEGVYWLLDDGGTMRGADLRFWRRFLDSRRRFIDDVLGWIRVLDMEPVRRSAILRALEVAQRCRDRITPEFCVEYLDTWRGDRKRWLDYLAEFGRHHTIDTALAALGLVPCRS